MIVKDGQTRILDIKVVILTLSYVLYTIANNANDNEFLDEEINILIWTTSDYPPLVHMVRENLLKCNLKNCFVTNYKIVNKRVTNYDIVLFDVIELRDKNLRLPTHRAVKQKYVFVSREPPALYGFDTVKLNYDNVFNLTWTFKLESDIALTYLIIKNKVGRIIGPKQNMKWIDFNDMKPIREKYKRKLQNKRKAAAWIVSNCKVPSDRDHFVQDLLKPALDKYELKVDIYGKCGEKRLCPDDSNVCYDKLKSDYYFYLAFENSFCEDYVTEKVLTATEHFTVPIVYGGADYTRFLPPGSYLDARALGPERLAFLMNEAINNKSKYYDFFKWRRYYSLHDPNENIETNDICKFCRFANDHKYVTYHTSSVYTNFTKFWTEFI